MTIDNNLTEAANAAQQNATPAVTKVPTGAATTKRGKRAGAASKKALTPTKAPRKPAASKAKAPTKPKAPKAKAGNTFTTVDLAKEHDINPKTLRARIRRNLDKWAPLFKDGEKHVFADNATTRKAVAALLDS